MSPGKPQPLELVRQLAPTRCPGYPTRFLDRMATSRWWSYQRERFPVAAHAPLVAAFSASAVCYSARLRGSGQLPSPAAFVAAFLTAILFFLQLRVADEIKDAEDDALYRPYRPVPRGLVTLGELRRVGIGAAVVQLGLALWLDARLVALLLGPWAYLALMSAEFGAGRWLRARPVTYMASHMVILPLIDLYATACDWRTAGHTMPPAGLGWFLAVSYCNGIVIEIGRKVRAPHDEERGVDTYTALWGTTAASWAWTAAVAGTGAFAWTAAVAVGTARATGVVLAAAVAFAVFVASAFRRHPDPTRARCVEVAAGAWTLAMYLSLGLLPLLVSGGRPS